MPIIVEERVWGLINLDGLEPDAFDEITLTNVSLLAELAPKRGDRPALARLTRGLRASRRNLPLCLRLSPPAASRPCGRGAGITRGRPPFAI